MSPSATSQLHAAIARKYPASPSQEDFIKLFTECAFHEVLASAPPVNIAFSWEYTMPRIARHAVRRQCQYARIPLLADYAEHVRVTLHALYAEHGITASLGHTA